MASLKDLTSRLTAFFQSINPMQTKTYSFDFRPPAAQAMGPERPMATPMPTISEDSIRQGLSRFGNAPIATQTAVLARAGQSLPSRVDPYLPTIMSLMETGGGSRQVAPNNPYNIRAMQNGRYQFINYPSVEVATLGGQNGPDFSQGLVGTVSNHPRYERFRQTGDMGDFFSAYTPQSDPNNPTNKQLKARYKTLRSLFQ